MSAPLLLVQSREGLSASLPDPAPHPFPPPPLFLPLLLNMLVMLLLLLLLLLLALLLRLASFPRWFCRALPIAKWRAGHPRSPRGVELMSKAEVPTDMRSASSWLFRDRRARSGVEGVEVEAEEAEAVAEAAAEAAEAVEVRVGVELRVGVEAAGVGSAALDAAAAMHCLRWACQCSRWQSRVQ